jgi:O-antigen ligase
MKLRWAIWENTIQILKDFPLLGSGLGTFAQIFPMYRSFYFRGLVTHAENDFLQLASEVGLVGLGLLAILFLFLFFKGGRSIRAEISPQRYIGRGALTGILALMVYSLVEKNLQVPANALLYTFLWGLAITPSFQKRSGQSDLMKRERGEADGPWE